MCVGSPDIIYMISGKRKSGKDFISDRLKARIGEAATIVRIAGPIKYLFSQHKNLDFERMLTADEYKEVQSGDGRVPGQGDGAGRRLLLQRVAQNVRRAQVSRLDCE